jgi:hypothetical protein
MKRRASTILLAIVTLTTLLIAAISISEVVRTELLISRSVDYVTVATYAAESGLEYNAWLLRKNSATTIAGINNSTLTLPNNSTWTLAANGASPNLYVSTLQPNQLLSFSAYDPDNPTNGGGKQSIKILRDNTKTAAGYTYFSSQILDLAFTYFVPGSGVIAPPTNNDVTSSKYGWFATAGGGATDQTIVNNGISSGNIFNFTLKNYCITSTCGVYPPFSILLCSGANGTGTCNMPGRAYLTSTGVYKGIRRVLIMDMPRVPEPSGLWAHSIFSECQLIKDPNNPAPSC